MANDFTTKNQNRKAHKDSTNPRKREARAARRAVGGAFGKENKETRSFLEIGTTAEKGGK